MATDSYHEEQKRIPFKRKAFDHAKEQNLEFDFKSREEPARAGQPAGIAPDVSSQKAIPPAAAGKSPVDASSRARSHEPNPRTETPADSQKPHLSTSSPSMTTSPNFSQFQQNIQRQSREQKAMGSILSGVAAVLLGSIILVALLAGFGGYVLYRDIQHQSVTVERLETNLRGEIKKLETGLRKTVEAVNTLDARTLAQKQQIEALKTQLTDLGNQSRKDHAAMQASQTSLVSLQRRIAELERREALR